MTSPTSTAGLEVVAWRFRFIGPKGAKWTVQKNKPAWYRDDQDTILEPLVTTASAQARIGELSERIGQLQADFDDCNLHRAAAVTRSTAAEARADRLAGALEEAHSYLEVLHSVTANATTKSSVWKVIKRARAALQQEPTT